MTVFVAGEPIVRAGESEIAGRRIAGRAIPCGDEAGALAFRFDPVDRAVRRRSEAPSVAAGPEDPEAWRPLFARIPPGPVLVGPAFPGERARGAFAAAAEAAVAAGRGVYLLDPDPSGLPDAPAHAVVALFCGIPGPALLAALAAAAARVAAGVLLPVLPGWTAEAGFQDAAIAACRRAGARFVGGFPLPATGEVRRLVVAARTELEPGSEEEYFDRVHHGDWEGASAAGVSRLERQAGRAGLAPRPPRPRGPFAPAANAAAAARLEELAEAEDRDEHRAALLRAAVRWLDELHRDLRPIVAEGNFRKVFPFGADIAPEVERALTAAAP